MGGILAGLGEFSGGVAKGISQDAENRARRAQARKFELENEAAQLEADKAKTYETIMKGFEVGKTRVGLGTAERPGAQAVFDEQQAARKQAEAEAQAAEPKGVIGKLAAALSLHNRQAIPAAAGIGAPQQVGIPAETVAAPPPAAAAAPGTVTPPPAAAPKAPVLTRPGDEIDAALFRSNALAASGQSDKAIAEHQRYSDLVSDRYLSNFGAMTPAEMAATMTATRGVRHDVQLKDGLYTVTTMEKDAKGNDVPVELYKDVTKDELKAGIAQHLQMSPEHRAALANASNGAGQRLLESRSVIAKRLVDADQAAATASNLRADAGETNAKTDDLKVNAQRLGQFRKDLDRFTKDEEILKDPAAAAAFARAGGIEHKGQFYNSSSQMDAETETLVKTSQNDFQAHIQAVQNAWKKNAMSGNGLVQMVNIPGKGKQFGVIDTRGRIIDYKPTPGEAQEAAQKHYIGKDPVAMGKLVSAALAAQAAPAATTPTAPTGAPPKKNTKGGTAAAAAAGEPAAQEPTTPRTVGASPVGPQVLRPGQRVKFNAKTMAIPPGYMMVPLPANRTQPAGEMQVVPTFKPGARGGKVKIPEDAIVGPPLAAGLPRGG